MLLGFVKGLEVPQKAVLSTGLFFWLLAKEKGCYGSVVYETYKGLPKLDDFIYMTTVSCSH